MDAGSHSTPAVGIVLLCVGLCVIMFAPAYLRSALNKQVKIPETEKRAKLSIRLAIQTLALFFLMVCGVFSLGKIYQAPIGFIIFAILAFGASFFFKKK